MSGNPEGAGGHNLPQWSYLYASMAIKEIINMKTLNPGQLNWACEFLDWTAPDTQICQTGLKP